MKINLYLFCILLILSYLCTYIYTNPTRMMHTNKIAHRAVGGYFEAHGPCELEMELSLL